MAEKEMVRVLYDYTYSPKGQVVSFKRGEDYILLKRTNDEWWSVYKAGNKPVFVPANYVEVIDKKQKKKIPPKPPKVPPKPPKPLEPEAVLKDLDDLLDNAMADDPLFTDEDGVDRDSVSLSEEKSDASLTTSTPDDDGSSSMGNLSSKEDKATTSSSDSLDVRDPKLKPITGSTDSLEVQDRKTRGSNSSINLEVRDSIMKGSNSSIDEQNNVRPSEMIYANSQIFSKSELKPKSTASLDRNLPTKLSVDINHGRSASMSTPVTISENGDSNSKKQPRPQPRVTGISYTEEEPCYANLQELHVKVPPPRPPLPKQLRPGQKNTADDDECPDYANMATLQATLTPKHPPPTKPPPGVSALGSAGVDWAMYNDAESGHVYYYNASTGKSSWHLPVNDREVDSEDGRNDSASSSLLNASSQMSSAAKRMNSFGTATMLEGFGSINEELGNKGSIPPGWTENKTEEGELFYTNELSPEKWFCSKDEGGQVYYFKDGTSESSWDLPDINPTLRHGSLEKVLSEDDRYRLNHPKTRASWSPGDFTAPKRVDIPVLKKLSPSAVREEDEEAETPGDVFDYNQGADGEIGAHSVRLSTIPPHTRIREMQTYLNKAKVGESGKKVKKNWSQSYVITTGPFMYFYKDQKSAQPKANMPLGKPEVQLELRGATVTLAPKEYSSKKNVIMISTVNGAQYLLQSDEKARMQDWHNTLVANIALLGGAQPAGSRETMSHRDNPPGSPSLRDKGAKARKPAKKGGTLERPTTPDDTLSGAEKNTKIKDWLLYWLLRRPTAESLKEKGIIKDGIFGSHLQSICDREKGPIPRFVTHCIQAVNARGLDLDGIYRISGNMANIQKLRFQVDQNEPYDLMSPELDVHDISGALKLFFRELQEPLFPFHMYEKFTKASQILSRPLKLKAFQDTVKELPRVNYVCMNQLIGHLRKVIENSKKNRMEAQNVAIVFGPTLMRLEEETGNMAANLVMQGQIVEFMLHEYKSIF